LTSSRTLHLHVDGASRGNPGEAGFGVHVSTPEGETLAELFGYLGQTTNNVAEYEGLLHALRYAAGKGARCIRVFSDSELVVRQLEGRYRVKNPGLRPLFEQARRLLAGFEDARVSHVRRAQNADADRLANRAVDEKASQLE
jgi:ribonuclease HI